MDEKFFARVYLTMAFIFTILATAKNPVIYMSRNLKREMFRVRPRYKRVTFLPPCLVIDQVLQALINRREVKGMILENTAHLKIPEDERRFWSPEFRLTVYKMVEKGSLIRGVIGPNSKIWSLFMFLYAADFVLLFIGVIMGISQWVLGMEAPMLWSVPAFIALWLIIYMAAQLGQLKARKQTERLWKFLDRAIDRGEKAGME